MQASASAGESPAQLEGRVALARSSGKKTNAPSSAQHIAGRGWVVWNEPVLTLRGIGFSAVVIPYRGGIAHDNYMPLPNSSIVWSGKETRISSLTAHRGIVTALAARGCAMSCVTFPNENSDELGARSRRLGPWEMIASMSQGADTYMSASGTQQRHSGGSLLWKGPPVTWLC